MLSEAASHERPVVLVFYTATAQAFCYTISSTGSKFFSCKKTPTNFFLYSPRRHQKQKGHYDAEKENLQRVESIGIAKCGTALRILRSAVFFQENDY